MNRRHYSQYYKPATQNIQCMDHGVKLTILVDTLFLSHNII